MTSRLLPCALLLAAVLGCSGLSASLQTGGRPSVGVSGTDCMGRVDAGYVVEENVCGMGNAVIETEDYSYVAAAWFSGVTLRKGDAVCGRLGETGFQTLVRTDGEEASFDLGHRGPSLAGARAELCD